MLRISILAALVAVAFAPARGAELSTLHDFCTKHDCVGGSGDMITSPLVRDAQGNLFGTTTKGGKYDGGTVFEMSYDAGKSRWSYRTIHDFTPPWQFGSAPGGPLIIDMNGNLYGTARNGGTSTFGEGTVFQLSPNDRGGWRIKLLYMFCRKHAGCTDGRWPQFGGVTYAGAAGGLPYDGQSPLYGTTNWGGAHDRGTVYMLRPNAGKKYWHHIVLHDFCGEAEGSHCLDGTDAQYPLTMDANGRLFGVALGGLHDTGIAYQFDTGAKTFSILHHFCSLDSCGDGGFPKSGMVLNGAGELLGTAASGGANGAGTIFKLDPDAASPTFAVLYDFCAMPECSDGSVPMGGLTIDAAGALYGTTSEGGANKSDARGVGGGTVFKLAPGKPYNRLYSFCAETDCSDGEYPQTSLLPGTDGALIGTTTVGGRHGHGTVFELAR